VAPNLCAVSSFVSEGTDPSTMSSPSLYIVLWKFWPFASWPPALRFSWRSCRMSTPSSDIFASLRLSPLFHWCLPVLPDVSFRKSVLSGPLVQLCPCLVPDNSVPYAVQKRQSRSTICTQRPASSTDPPKPWVCFVGWPRYLRARCQSLCHFFIAPKASTPASSLGTS
jgi:hypothetical protein